RVTVQAWDNKGGVYKNPISVTVGPSGGTQPPTPPPPPPPPPSNVNQWGWTTPLSAVAPYSTNLSSTSNWLAATWVRADGGLFDSDFIRPYLGNLSALGMVRDPNRYGAVQAWMKWYIVHLNY